MDRKTTVFVVDDDPSAMESVVAVLDAHGYVCRAYRSAESFLAKYDPAPYQPRCLVTDLAMPGMSGLELHRELGQRGWSIPTVVVSGYADVRSTVQFMQEGAVTVLEKPYMTDELLNAIRAALADASRSANRAESLDRLNEEFAMLTDAECAVVDRLLSGQTNKAMAIDLGVAVRTIEHRRQRVYAKLGVDNVAQLAMKIAERDYLQNTTMPSVRDRA